MISFLNINKEKKIKIIKVATKNVLVPNIFDKL